MEFLFHIRWFLYTRLWLFIVWLFAWAGVLILASLQFVMPVTLIVAAILTVTVVIAAGAIIITDSSLEEQRMNREREDH